MTFAPPPSGRKVYFGALVVAQFAALLRYVVLARLLGPEQVGLAAIIVLTAQFFDSITDTGNDRFLIQDREGGSRGALNLVHLVAIAKGVGIAFVLMALAAPIADFAGAPQLTETLRVLAIVPLLTGFTNFDFRLAQRHHKFAPEAMVLLTSEVTGLVVTLGAAIILRDFSAILYGLAARAAAVVLASHVAASCRYGFGYSPALARRLWRFGAPLILNGLLLFIATQSDRIIISRMLGLEELGRYSILILLVYYPVGMLMRFLTALFLPKIAEHIDSPQQLISAANMLGSTNLLLAVGICIGFAFVVPPLLPVIFGPAFEQPPLNVALVGILMAIRLMKVSPTTVALGTAGTWIVVINNVLRLSGVIVAIAGVVLFGGLAGVVAGLIVGEMVANIAATLLVNGTANWPLTRELDRYALFGGVAGSLVLGALAVEEGRWFLELGAAVLSSIIAVLVVWREWETLKKSAIVFKRAIRL